MSVTGAQAAHVTRKTRHRTQMLLSRVGLQTFSLAWDDAYGVESVRLEA